MSDNTIQFSIETLDILLNSYSGFCEVIWNSVERSPGVLWLYGIAPYSDMKLSVATSSVSGGGSVPSSPAYISTSVEGVRGMNPSVVFNRRACLPTGDSQ